MTQPEDISVAVIEQSGRSENLIAPLQATDMDVAVDPADPYGRDIVVVDTPDREMAYEVLKKPLHDAKLVFRMRGDPWFGIDEWIDSRLKAWLAKHVVIPGVDGCITITPSHAQLFEHKTGIHSTTACLPIKPDDWPDSSHASYELRILSLTNLMYRPKFEPLLEAAPVVDDVLETVGGHWRIGGKGNYEDEFVTALRDFEHISFGGYVDAHESLTWANCMVHLSRLDGFPNAVLEAMAARLPVVTNDHHAFADKDRPNVIASSHDELRQCLRRFTDPQERADLGAAGLEYVRREHNCETIGQHYVAYFRRLLSRDSFERLHGIPHPDEMIRHDG